MNDRDKPQRPIPIVAIDGPSGVGKGTLSSRLALHLGWHFLDSGALYRMLAYSLIQGDLSPEFLLQKDHEALLDYLRSLKFGFTIKSELESSKPVVRSFVGTEDVSQVIRSERCGVEASHLALHISIRQALLPIQRSFICSPGLVADGRDMGTVVFPEAQLKVFLQASLEERAERRYQQLKAQGLSFSWEEVFQKMKERDLRDTQRAHSPLKPAFNAFILDTTQLKVEEVFEKVLQCL